jgi:CheY-like chemotaxis protein
MSQWLFGNFTPPETEVAECKAYSPCAVDDPGIPTMRVSQNPLTPKRTRRQIGSREWQRRNHSTTSGDFWLSRFDHLWSPVRPVSRFDQTECGGMPYHGGNSLFMRHDEYPAAILLVDDDDFVRKLVKECLERAGYTVFAACDGNTGLDFFKQKQKEIALLLTDIVMPNMNGVDLADRILELDRTLPVVFMSGTVVADRGNGCITKPFRGSEVVAKVGTALRSRPLGRPIPKTDGTLAS